MKRTAQAFTLIQYVLYSLKLLVIFIGIGLVVLFTQVHLSEKNILQSLILFVGLLLLILIYFWKE